MIRTILSRLRAALGRSKATAPAKPPHKPGADPNERFPSPSREEMLELPVFQGLGMKSIRLVSTADDAAAALPELLKEKILGFDTESKPIFRPGQTSDGPHVAQFSTLKTAYVFQLFDAECRRAVGALLKSPQVVKVGFGLRHDKRSIPRKFGVQGRAIIDIDNIFRRHGYRAEVGVKAAVAVIFRKRFIKSKRATTSNWRNRELNEKQILYAANDAYAAIKVFHALKYPDKHKITD